MTFFAPTEDTMPPSHFHEMGGVRVVTDADGNERRQMTWVPIVDLDTAREIVLYELAMEMAEAHPLTAEAKTVADNLAVAIAQAPDFDTLITIDIAVPRRPPVDRRLTNYTRVQAI